MTGCDHVSPWSVLKATQLELPPPQIRHPKLRILDVSPLIRDALLRKKNRRDDNQREDAET